MKYFLRNLLEFERRQHILSKNSQGTSLDRMQNEQVSVSVCIHLLPRIGIGKEWGSSGVEAVRHKIFLGYADDRHTDQ